MRKKIRVGLIGVGKMGQNHLRILSILKGVEVSFIHDENSATASSLATVYGVKAVDNPFEHLKSTDAVVIASPTVTHADFVKKVGKKVRNIFVEKPLSATLAEAEDLAAFAQTANLNMQIGFIERFNPAVQATKRILSQSDKIINIDFTRTNKLSARITDVDVVTDLMIHDIDLAIYMNGPVKAVEAHGMAQGTMIDFASALLTHTNGSFSRIQASRVTEKKMRMIQATCSDMFVDCDLLRKEIVISRQSEIRQLEGEPYTIGALQEYVEVRPQEALLSELQAFMSSCRGEISDDHPGIQAGLNAMIICDQIQNAVLR
jgi:predicted dehydrogenase